LIHHIFFFNNIGTRSYIFLYKGNHKEVGNIPLHNNFVKLYNNGDGQTIQWPKEKRTQEKSNGFKTLQTQN
jgi:hypothetical protein